MPIVHGIYRQWVDIPVDIWDRGQVLLERGGIDCVLDNRWGVDLGIDRVSNGGRGKSGG